MFKFSLKDKIIGPKKLIKGETKIITSFTMFE